MSIFKFPHQKNPIHHNHNKPSVYYLTEQYDLCNEEDATRFIVKKRNQHGGFQEFFGVIKDPKHILDGGGKIIRPKLPFLDEDNENTYKMYGLDKTKWINIDNKEIPMYIPKDFLDVTPLKFGNQTRTIDQIAQSSVRRRQMIYDFYLTLDPKFIETLSEIQCTSVASLYNYLNNGEKWVPGYEEFGFVDGLYESPNWITVSIDTSTFDIGTACHELGHSISFFLIDEMYYEWYNLAIDKTEIPGTAYAKTQICEDFAESLKLSFVPQFKQQFQKKCPRRFVYMEKLRSMGENALIKNPNINQLTKRFKVYDKVVWE